MTALDRYPIIYPMLCLWVGMMLAFFSWFPSVASGFVPGYPYYPFNPLMWIVGAASGTWGLLWWMLITVRTQSEKRNGKTIKEID